MKIDPRSFSEIARTLSPGRFLRFMAHVLDVSEGYPSNPSRAPLGVRKDEVVPADIFRSILRYVDTRPVYHSGTTKSRTRFFILTHHVPSLISDLDFLDILKMDLLELKRSKVYPKFLLEATEEYAYDERQIYYGTNKDYFLQWKDNKDGYGRELDRVHEEADLEFHVDCIEPSSMAKSAENEASLLEALKQPDGVWVQITESGVDIRPFMAADVMFGENSAESFILNVDATIFARQRMTALQGLQDILALNPREGRIEAFLVDHPEILGSMGFVDLRTQVTISPEGDRPDFLLETPDGLWELLELKRPKAKRELFVEKPDGAAELARYLRVSLEQCSEYLRILKSEHTQKRLIQKGIRVGQPRITLLIGREQYPKSVLDLVERRYGELIVLKSFEQLFEDCKRKFAILLSAMVSVGAS